jgi:hypothetical protein
MRTVVIDIVNEKVWKLLQDLEILKLIRFRKDVSGEGSFKSSVKLSNLRGRVSKQSESEIDRQLKALRGEWQKNF